MTNKKSGSARASLLAKSQNQNSNSQISDIILSHEHPADAETQQVSPDDSLVRIFKEWCNRRGLTAAEISRACNFPSANALYNFRNSRKNRLSLSLPTYLSISKAFNVSIDELVGNTQIRQNSTDNQGLLVLSKAGPGNFQRSPYLPPSEQYRVHLPCNNRDIVNGAYCVEHDSEATSLGKTPKELLVVKPFVARSDHLIPGGFVIVHRTNPRGIEILVSKIETYEGSLTLELPTGLIPNSKVRLIVKTDGRILGSGGKNVSIQAMVRGRWQAFSE